MKTHLRAAEFLVDLLENRFQFMGKRFGLEPLMGLVPGIGDALGMLISSYVVWIGMRMGMPGSQIRRMIWNLVVDMLLGAAPIVGDLVDFFYKANTKNLKILRAFAESEQSKKEVSG